MKQTWVRFKNKYFHTIKNQLVIFLIFSTIIPILCVQIINHNLTSDIIAKKNDAILNDNLILSKSNANNVIGDYRKLLYQITTDDTFLEKISLFNKTDVGTKQYTDCQDTITDHINTLCLMHQEVRAVGVVDDSGKTILVNQERPENQHIQAFFKQQNRKVSLETVNSLNPLLGIIQPENACYDKDDPIFYISYRAFDLVTMKILGSIILFIQPSELNKSINNKNNATYDFCDKILITADNRVLCHKSNESIGENIDKIAGYGSIATLLKQRQQESNEKSTFAILTDMDDFGLKLVDVIDNDKLLGEIHRQWITSFGLIFIVMILALMIAYGFSHNIVRSILHMSSVMNQFNKDNLDISVSESSKNEVRLVEAAFNSMAKRISNLIEENQQQYNRIVQITKDSNIAELKSLELEINPHFLFNTIDTINWMAIREGCADISEQLNNLAHILRYTTYNLNGIVMLKDEIEWMKHYLELQKNRFPNRFNYQISVDANALDFRLYKMILQPFIENSIIHGFDGIQRNGNLLITMHLLNQRYLLIKIWDNGCGIPKEKIRQINRLFYTCGKPYNFGIGLENIAFRIYRYYNGKAKVYVSSDRNITCFTLFIPNGMQLEEGEND